MLFARHARVVEVIVGWGSAGGSVIAFIWDSMTPHSGFSGRLAIGFAVLSGAIYLGVKIENATASVRDCVDRTIGAATQFGRDAERRRSDDRAELASVRPFVPRNNKGGNR